jgi:hypothetical protein
MRSEHGRVRSGLDLSTIEWQDDGMLRRFFPFVSAAWLTFGCSPSEPPPPDYPQGAVPLPEKSPAPATEPTAEGSSADAPEISRSVGVPSGVVVLWPRIVLTRQGPAKADEPTRELARNLQARVADLVRAAVPGKNVDVRPEPERVCPRSGCTAASVGILLAKAGDGCAAVALVSAPGTSPMKLVPWLGAARLTSETVPFRAQAEEAVRVTDFSKCAGLASEKDHDADVQASIKSAAK